MGCNSRNAYRIFKRDSRNHASPNSAQTESVVAGALEIQLAGDAYYFGKLYKKPFIGDGIKPIKYDNIADSIKLMYMTSVNFGGAVCRIESGGRCCIWYMSMAVTFTEIRCVLTFR